MLTISTSATFESLGKSFGILNPLGVFSSSLQDSDPHGSGLFAILTQPSALTVLALTALFPSIYRCLP